MSAKPDLINLDIYNLKLLDTKMEFIDLEGNRIDVPVYEAIQKADSVGKALLAAMIEKYKNPPTFPKADQDLKDDLAIFGRRYEFLHKVKRKADELSSDLKAIKPLGDPSEEVNEGEVKNLKDLEEVIQKIDRVSSELEYNYLTRSWRGWALADYIHKLSELCEYI